MWGEDTGFFVFEGAQDAWFGTAVRTGCVGRECAASRSRYAGFLRLRMHGLGWRYAPVSARGGVPPLRRWGALRTEPPLRVTGRLRRFVVSLRGGVPPLRRWGALRTEPPLRVTGRLRRFVVSLRGGVPPLRRWGALRTEPPLRVTGRNARISSTHDICHVQVMTLCTAAARKPAV